MSYSFEGFAQQGWQCPICKRVYSPTTPMCWYCGNGVTTTSTSTSTPIMINKKDIEDGFSDYVLKGNRLVPKEVELVQHETER